MSLTTSAYENILRPIFFSFPPDEMHEFFNATGELLGSNFATRGAVAAFCKYENPMLETDVFGLHFKNPVGLAGGFDKEAKLMQLMPSVGFGFTEVGSITALPYPGNPKPWTKRLPAQKAIIVNYGLKGPGLEVMKKKIMAKKRFCPVILNIAKTNEPSIKGAASIEDYNKSFVELQPLADIININVSCPNSGDGTMFCENPELLSALLKRLNRNEISKPVVLKLKPDLSDKTLDEVLSIAGKYKFVKGFAISNLTNNRNFLKGIDAKKIEKYPGGISGLPVRDLSTSMIRRVYEKTNGKYAIIGIGGIFRAEDAYEKIKNGASLVELITGLIYRGPTVVKEINQGLVGLLKKDGIQKLSEAVGADVK